jgi:hypothetical protein
MQIKFVAHRQKTSGYASCGCDKQIATIDAGGSRGFYGHGRKVFEQSCRERKQQCLKSFKSPDHFLSTFTAFSSPFNIQR